MLQFSNQFGHFAHRTRLDKHRIGALSLNVCNAKSVFKEKKNIITLCYRKEDV